MHPHNELIGVAQTANGISSRHAAACVEISRSFVKPVRTRSSVRENLIWATASSGVVALLMVICSCRKNTL